LQDQALAISVYPLKTPIDNSSNTHVPTTMATSFVTLPQILSKSDADSHVRELKSTISKRAAAIVASGAAVSQIGLEKIFRAQAMQFGEQDVNGILACVWFWFKALLLNDEICSAYREDRTHFN
jgi:choline dehydrogenase